MKCDEFVLYERKKAIMTITATEKVLKCCFLSYVMGEGLSLIYLCCICLPKVHILYC